MPSLDYDCMCVTTMDGDSVFVGLSPEDHTFDFYNEDIPTLSHETSCLLSKPISELMKKVDETRFNSKSKDKLIDSYMRELEDASTFQNSSDARLLVNKYAPKKFIDLVTNEVLYKLVLFELKTNFQLSKRESTEKC